MINEVFLHNLKANCWNRFRDPVSIIISYNLAEDLSCLQSIERIVNERNLHAVGFLSYEAGASFDSAYPIREIGEFPYLWFGLYEGFDVCERLPVVSTGTRQIKWLPDISFKSYATKINTIKEHIAEGETYQVNFTFMLHACMQGIDPLGLFASIASVRPPPYACYIDIGRFAVLSLSPELFFELDGATLRTRPMKGTARRGRTLFEDDVHARSLESSPKNRAENVMIVDMLRNDLGRVARTGTVEVEKLFEVERYPTILQMTSSVSCKTDRSFSDIIAALFPCASISGAPKIRTMHIIHNLEREPRRIYTGAIGCLYPKRKAGFNVAIRTVLFNKKDLKAQYGVGGGIVWDSLADAEYSECMLKAQNLVSPQPVFSLIETMLWTPDEGYFLLDRHLDRLDASARYFGFPFNRNSIISYLNERKRLLNAPVCIRLLVERGGGHSATLNTIDIESFEDEVINLGVAPWPIRSDNAFLFHKTTQRNVYDELRRQTGYADDVILWNEREEICETTIGNIVLELEGKLLTPRWDCGLLPGVFRAHLLERGTISEAIITPESLAVATRIFRINSVRKWQICKLASMSSICGKRGPLSHVRH